MEFTTSIEENFRIGMPSVFLLSHNRHLHLDKTLSSLQKCLSIGDFNIVLVSQDPSEKVELLLKKAKFDNKSQFVVHLPSQWSVQKKINMNMKIGTEIVFERIHSNWAVVLEDDIILSSDALVFLRLSEDKFRNNRNYRGTNCFSKMPPKIEKDEEWDFVRLNYGVGWGWTVNKFNYSQIQKYWTGFEDQHWDGFLEPYFRTGFVVNPWRSRCVNIGLDGSGSNTKLHIELERAMLESAGINRGQYLEGDFKEKTAEYFQWVHTCYQMSGLNNKKEQFIYFLFKIHHLLHRMYFADLTSKWKGLALTQFRKIVSLLLNSKLYMGQLK